MEPDVFNKIAQARRAAKTLHDAGDHEQAQLLNQLAFLLDSNASERERVAKQLEQDAPLAAEARLFWERERVNSESDRHERIGGDALSLYRGIRRVMLR